MSNFYFHHGASNKQKRTTRATMAMRAATRLARPNKAIFVLTPSAKTRLRELMKQRKEETQKGNVIIFLLDLMIFRDHRNQSRYKVWRM